MREERGKEEEGKKEGGGKERGRKKGRRKKGRREEGYESTPHHFLRTVTLPDLVNLSLQLLAFIP